MAIETAVAPGLLVAIVVTFAFTVAVTLGLAYNPVNAFAMTGTGIVIVLVAIYILMNVACIGYFGSPARRRGGRRWNPLPHLIIPLLGIAAFVPAWLTGRASGCSPSWRPWSRPRRTWDPASLGGWRSAWCICGTCTHGTRAV